MPANTPTGPVRRIRHVAAALQAFPAQLEEDALLRIHQLRFLRADAEERGVEQSRRRRSRRAPARSRDRRVRRRGTPGSSSSARRSVIVSRPSHRLRQNASTSAAPGKRPAMRDDRDRIVDVALRRLARGAPPADARGVDACGSMPLAQSRRASAAGVGCWKIAVAATPCQPALLRACADAFEQAARPAANCRRARRNCRGGRPGRCRAVRRTHRRPRCSSRVDGRLVGRGEFGTRTSGAGSARRSSLPLAVTGSASSRT